MNRILIVEDDENFGELIKIHLEREGYKVDEATDLPGAAQKIGQGDYDVFILDVMLPGGTSLILFDKYQTKLEGKTLIITANPNLPDVVHSIRQGAFNYIEKPVEKEVLLEQAKRILESNRLKAERQSIFTELSANYSFSNIVYQSEAMGMVIEKLKILAKTGITVLIQGETGVGKEVLAHSIHNDSDRAPQVFLPLNCASIPAELFESELFGFEKGAFTGAVDSYSGRFIQADKGTLFLDEIGELPLYIQAKLLRILDEKAIYRLKGKESVNIDVRLIAATNRNLLQEVKAKQFRSDLYYRLKETSIIIPPLRERPEDILPLIRHFINVFNPVYQKNVNKISREAENFFLSYAWEGNVRELKNTVKSIIPFKQDDTIRLDDLSYAVVQGSDRGANRLPTLEEHNKKYIFRVLKSTGFSLKESAEILGITRERISRKVRQLNLEDVVPDDDEAIN